MAIFFFRFGMFVSTFDNGTLRFVALPEFGLFLLSLLLLPNLIEFGRWTRFPVFMLGTMAIVVGGSRSGLAMAIVIVTVIPLLRGKFLQFAAITGVDGARFSSHLL